MKRTEILMGRMNKLETLQTKLSNLKDCRVFGGNLPQYVIDGIKTPEMQNKIQAKIDHAERIRLDIAIHIYEDIEQ